jgi:hypothetical protein
VRHPWFLEFLRRLAEKPQTRIRRGSALHKLTAHASKTIDFEGPAARASSLADGQGRAPQHEVAPNILPTAVVPLAGYG